MLCIFLKLRHFQGAVIAFQSYEVNENHEWINFNFCIIRVLKTSVDPQIHKFLTTPLIRELETY